MSNLPKGWGIGIRSGRVALAVPPRVGQPAYRLTVVESIAVAHELATALGLSNTEVTAVEDASSVAGGGMRWVVTMDRDHLVLHVSPAEQSGIYILTDLETAALALALMEGRRYVEAFIIGQLACEVTDGRSDAGEASGDRPDEGGPR